jgi:phosphomannomutase
MYGTGAGYLPSLLEGGATKVTELHGFRNPAFPGMHAPEPIARNLTELSVTIAAGGFDGGIATDGDADRVGIADEKGNFINQLQVFALLAHYMLEARGERGAIVKSVTTTRMVQLLGDIYGVPVHETRVGFKFLGPKMMETVAMLAGEESGGYAFRGHIPERDGLLSALCILDFMAKTGKRPSALLADLYDRVGPHEYDRVDITIRTEERATIEAHVQATLPATIAGMRVESRDEIDGYRFNLEGGWWLLMRFSGTEPLLRIYAEMPSRELVQQALAAGQEIAGVTL